jgi:hypothetical protein
MTQQDQRLPAGFEELEPFVAFWAGKTSQARMNARCSSSMEDIQRFYNAMTPRTEEALCYIEQFPIDAIPEDANRLLCLVLALAQAHISVEVHGTARAPNTPWPNAIRIVHGLPLLG